MRRIILMVLGMALAGVCGLWVTPASAAAPPRDVASEPQLDLPLEGQATKPEWRSLPSGDDMAKEYPKLAQFMELTGSALIDCSTDTDGSLKDCKVLKESPAGFGFGAAALRLAPYFSMKPAQMDGQPVKSTVKIPIKFALDGSANVAAEPEPPPPTSPAALELARKVLALQDISERMKQLSRPSVSRMVSDAVLNGDIDSGAPALDAFLLGLDDVIQAIIERHAHTMAAQMTEAQLRATIDFLESPAGRAWMAVGIDITPPADFIRRLGAAARNHLCVSAACPTGGQPKP